MFWKQLLFRMLGVVCSFAGLFALYAFGKELTPLFEQFVAGTHDSFLMFTTLTSFFLGGISLVWVGGRLTALRSFSSTWLYYAMIPISVWLQDLYDVGLIFSMDKVLSQSVMFLITYSIVMFVVLFVHKYWFTPVSHESMRHVALVEPERPRSRVVHWIVVGIVLFGLLALHPTDIGTTLRMLFSPINYLINLI